MSGSGGEIGTEIGICIGRCRDGDRGRHGLVGCIRERDRNKDMGWGWG